MNLACLQAESPFDQEIWLPVSGYERAYEVSNLGRVRSLDRLVSSGKGDGLRACKGRMLRPGRKSSGHLSVALGRTGGSHDVHILVLEAFVGACPVDMESLHGDDDPANNRLENLRWGTRGENLLDAVKNGKKAVGAAVWNAKLDDEKVRRIRASNGRPCALARKYSVSEATIRQVLNNKSWKGVK